MATSERIYCSCALWAVLPEAYQIWGDLRGHHPNCDGTGQHKNGVFKMSELSNEACAPTLQLLIVDMGDCCVVKVEKGDVAMFVSA